MSELAKELRRIGKMHRKPEKQAKALKGLKAKLRSARGGWVTPAEAVVLCAWGVDPAGKPQGVSGQTIHKRFRTGHLTYKRWHGRYVEYWADEVAPPANRPPKKPTEPAVGVWKSAGFRPQVA